MKSVDGLYLHFPFCRHLCNYCDFYKHKLSDDEQVSKYEKVLSDQIIMNNKILSDHDFIMNELETFYIGGGTPSLWSTRGSEFLASCLLPKFNFAEDYEFTIEVDPGTWTEKEIRKWMDIGVNRFSIGVQSFDRDYLNILDREHSIDDIIDTVSFMKSINANYSVDLMLGVPLLDKKRDIVKEIEDLVQYNPNHFSVYILKCRSNYPNLNMLPDDEVVADEYLKVCQFLGQLGFEQYEVSNFAKEGFQSKHNKKYWEYKSVAALGANGSGLLVNSDELALRYQWKSLSDGYITEQLSDSSLSIEKFYMQLRAKGCFDLNALSTKNFNEFQKLIQKWKSLGYVDVKSSEFSLSPRGYLLLDSLMDDVFNNVSL